MVHLFLKESGVWLSRLNEAGNTVGSEIKIWAGNAKTCAICEVDGEQRLFLGTEPADVLVSNDMGATWRGTDSFATIPDRQARFIHLAVCGLVNTPGHTVHMCITSLNATTEFMGALT